MDHSSLLLYRHDSESLGATCEAETQELRVALQKAAAERARLAAIVDSADDGIIGKSLEGVVFSWNAAAERIYGYSAAEMLEASIRRVVPPERMAEWQDMQGRVARGKRVEHLETVRLRKDGRRVEVSLTVSPIKEESGQLIGISTIVRDITARKRTEAQLAAFAALGTGLGAAQTVRQAAEVILKAADRLFGWDACALDLYAAPKNELRHVLYMDLIDGQRTECAPTNITEEPSPRAQSVLREGAKLFERPADGEVNPNAIPFGDRSRPSASVMCVPIRNGSAVIGLLSLHSYTPKAFNPGTLQACQALAEHCGGALERIRAEEALSESEANYRLLVERSPDAVFIHREEKFVYANPAGLRLLGATQPQQLLGRSIWDIVPEAYREVVQRRVRQSTALEPNALLEQQIRRLDGTIVDVEAIGIPFQYQGKRAVQTIMRDITARKRADEQILSQAMLLEVAQDAITVQDLAGRIRFWNQGAARLYGWSLEEALSQHSETLLPPVTGPSLQEVRRHVLAHGHWTGELRHCTKDQREITVLSRWSLVHDLQGKPRSLLSVSTDITEKKQLEARLMRSQRLESIGRLASGIAHDLNNVLTPVMMAVQLLDDTCERDSDRAILQTLHTCAKRGAGIVQQVLLFARGTEGTRVLLHPKRLLQEMAQIAQETFPRTITIKTSFDRNPWSILADHTQMQQVLMNLCVNARDAMPSGGLLRLQTQNRQLDAAQTSLHPKARPGRYVVLQVSDTGTGIPPEILEKVFDPFFTTKPAGQGTGLGLPTVMGIVEGHEGFVTVESKVGTGTQFSVYLPAAEDEGREFAPPPPAAQPRGKGELVLVVDDESAIRGLLRTTLESFGYRVLTASAGEEALRYYRAHSSEIKSVILDLMMPGLSWRATVQRLHQLNPQLPIIAMSGLSTDLTALKQEVPGIASVLAKPFPPTVLLDTVATLLKAAPAS